MIGRWRGPVALTLALLAGQAAALGGTLREPLYRGLAGGTISVRYQVYPHSDRSRRPLEPVVAIEGGPGYGSIGSASYYLDLLGALGGRHDLILMDDRGTGGSGAIDCRRLQSGRGSYAAAVGACARQLRAAAGAYGSGAAADDLADVLDHLGVQRVDLYGDSYGTYLAQAFAVRHPQRVRAVVLDGAFAISGYDPFEREGSAALRRAWRTVCSSSPGCRGPILPQLAALARRLGAHPLVGRSRDADGALASVRVDASGLAQIVADADSSYTIFRDLAAAGRSLRHGDAAPLLRLGAEDLSSLSSGDPVDYSEGDYAAVACHDYPTVWDVAAPIAERRRQLAAAEARVSPAAFAPFDRATWLASPNEDELVRGCLDWPAPPIADPAAPVGVAYPRAPVLVMDGALDMRTPLADARRAAASFPRSRLVAVANTGHVTALADADGCTSGIVRRFLRTLRPGATGCATRIAEIHVMPAFPLETAAAPALARPLTGDSSTALERRAAWVAAATVADAYARYQLMYGSDGHGLRGGRFTTGGDYLGHGAVPIRFLATRLTRDLPVSGRAVWDRHALEIRAAVTVGGAARGRLSVTWPTHRQHARATVVGRLDGRSLRVVLPAP